MPKKDYPNEATRKRSISEREVLDLIKDKVAECKRGKAGAIRNSQHWHRMDSAIMRLTELKKDIRAAISRGRKP